MSEVLIFAFGFLLGFIVGLFVGLKMLKDKIMSMTPGGVEKDAPDMEELTDAMDNLMGGMDQPEEDKNAN